MKKKIFLCLSTLIVISLITSGCGKKAELKDGAEVAISVKGEKITATDYYEDIKEDNISHLIDMIDHNLLDKKYKTDKEENEAVEKQISQISSQYSSDEETYKSVLRQYFGVETEKELDEMLRLEYKRTKAVEDYIKKNLSDKEIKKYYDENIYGDVEVSHILISLNVSDDATDKEKEEAEKEALEKAQEVIKKLDDGEDFAKLAKKYSTDEATAKNGGSLGYVSLDEVDDDFAEAVKKLNKNEYTKEPVKTEFGYHIILKTNSKSKPKLSKVKDDIKDKLKDEKLNADPTLHYKTLEKIRKDNNIKWNDSKLKKAYENYMDTLIDAASSN